MLSTLERVLLLKGVALFAASPDEVLAALAPRLTERDLPAGATLFVAGAPGASLFIVVAGELVVTAGRQELNRVGPREVVGEMALLDPAPRLATVVAVTDTRLLEVDEGAFRAVLGERPEVARGVIQVLTRRLRLRVAALSPADAR
jgi:CRP-like cAMP-binding protein